MDNNELEGVDPRLIDAMRTKLSDPSQLEGVDPRLVQAMRARLGVEDPAVLARAHAAAQESGAPENFGEQVVAPVKAMFGAADRMSGGGNGSSFGNILGLPAQVANSLPQTPNQFAIQVGLEGLGMGASELGNAIRSDPGATSALAKAEYLRSGLDEASAARAIKDPSVLNRALSPKDAGSVYEDSLGQLGLKGGSQATVDQANKLGVGLESDAGKMNGWVSDVKERVLNADQLKNDALSSASKVAEQHQTIANLKNLADQYDSLAQSLGRNGAPNLNNEAMKYAEMAQDFKDRLVQAQKDLPAILNNADEALAKVPTAQDAITASQWAKAQTSAPREFPAPQGAQSRMAKKLPIAYDTIQQLDKYAQQEIESMGNFPKPIHIEGYGPIQSYSDLKQVYADSMLNAKMGKLFPMTKSGAPSQTRALLAVMEGAKGAALLPFQSPLVGRTALKGAYVAPDVLKALGPLGSLLQNRIQGNGSEQNK